MEMMKRHGTKTYVYSNIQVQIYQSSLVLLFSLYCLVWNTRFHIAEGSVMSESPFPAFQI